MKKIRIINKIVFFLIFKYCLFFNLESTLKTSKNLSFHISEITRPIEMKLKRINKFKKYIYVSKKPAWKKIFV